MINLKRNLNLNSKNSASAKFLESRLIKQDSNKKKSPQKKRNLSKKIGNVAQMRDIIEVKTKGEDDQHEEELEEL